MSKIKASLPKGTRDFLPLQKSRRNFIVETIRDVYLRFGFQEIETPAMENIETLTGKYGEEGDKLLFRILNSGEFTKKMDLEAAQAGDYKKVAAGISEKGLHYDLTVPLARFVSMHQNDIILPFRRFQIQPVWRADRPQKGRYREFYQCDADVIGSDSLWNEIDLIKIFADVFQRLGIEVSIKINNRKILAGLAEQFGHLDRLTSFTITLDKADKIGAEKVKSELERDGFPEDFIQALDGILWSGDAGNEEQILKLEQHLQNETGQLGISELKFLLANLTSENLEVDPSLARGLDYYTGTIFEVVPKEVKIGSIASGGRYDDLTELFGVKDLSGVGISFGLDRIYDVLEELDRFPPAAQTATDVLFVNFDDESARYSQDIMARLRTGGLNVELYPDPAKLKKQFKYADSKSIPNVLMAGSEEIKSGLVSWKKMKTGEQLNLPVKELIDKLLDAKKPWL